MMRVAVLVGSLRKESYTRKVAKVLMQVAPAEMRCELIEIGDLPLYNQELETAQPPAAWVRFREQVRSSDAVLFVTPEYNRSVPGALKNAIDVGSRPRETPAWKSKPAGIVSVSPGALSAFGANHHLRQMLVFLDMPTLQQPEVYIGGVAKLFDANGNMTNDGTRDFLHKFMGSFAQWIERTSAAPAHLAVGGASQ